MNKADLFAAVKTKRIAVTIPGVDEPGSHLWVRSMPVGEKESYEQWWNDHSTDKAFPAKWRAEFLRRVCVDESGALLFGADDVDALCGWPTATVEYIVRIAESLNLVDEAAIEAAKKNF